MSNTPATTDNTFRTDVLESDLPVLVDFWADWCGPCRMLAPAIDQIAQEMAGKLRVFKLDVDSNPLTSTTYGIQSIPTLILFSGGSPAGQFVGYKGKQTLLDEIERAIGVKP